MGEEVVVSTPDNPVPADLIKINLTPGETEFQDFVNLGFNVKKYPWPLAANTVDEARCNNYLHKLDGPELVEFMNELYRVLKPSKGAMVSVPFGFSVKGLTDPFAKRLLVADSFFPFDAEYRKVNGYVGGVYDKIATNFEVSFPSSNVDTMLMTRNFETQQWMSRHLVNAVHDLIVQVVKK